EIEGEAFLRRKACRSGKHFGFLVYPPRRFWNRRHTARVNDTDLFPPIIDKLFKRERRKQKMRAANSQAINLNEEKDVTRLGNLSLQNKHSRKVLVKYGQTQIIAE